MNITIKEITADNWIAAIKLKVKDEQVNFVASNAASIAQSKFHPFLECYGIYNDDEMVGFSALGKNPEDDTIWIVRHMVDGNHQGKGYGKAGLKAVIKFMQEKFKTDSIFLDVAKENEIATSLYIKAGFKNTGKKHGESPILKLDLKEYSEDY
jgi:diamine N-acetyltransferase